MTHPLPLKTKVVLFLYSTKNLVGCALGLVGLALFFSGVIEDWWLAIVLGLYVAGWLIGPECKDVALAHRASLAECINDLASRTRKRLPTDAIALLESIRQTVETIAPRLNDGTLNIEQKAAIINSVTRDLPETLTNYLRLPPVFANVHVVEKGKTCKMLLLDQLSILDTQLKKIADSIYRDDADALILNGHILSEKFHTVNFVH